MRKALLLLTPLLLSLNSAEQQFALATYEFGYSLNDGQYFIYKVFEGEVVESDPISLGSFIRQATGREKSRANLDGENLFDVYDITGCDVYTDSMNDKEFEMCSALDDLWKLRYGGGTSGTGTSGWASDVFAPSDRQQIILQAYRSTDREHWLGPYFGKQAFQLLHDIQDPAWVKTYQRGG